MLMYSDLRLCLFDCCFFLLQLLLYQIVIYSSGGDQRLMIPLFHHFTFTHYHNLMGIDDSGKTMSDKDNGRASFCNETINRFLYLSESNIIMVIIIGIIIVIIVIIVVIMDRIIIVIINQKVHTNKMGQGQG